MTLPRFPRSSAPPRTGALRTGILAAVLAVSPLQAASHAGEGKMLGDTEGIVAGDLVIEGAWTRQPPPGARAGGAYLAVTNRGDAPDRLTGGSAAFAEAVEIHAMSVADGVMRMERLEDGIEIAPGETVRLMPGGDHVMMIGLAPDALVNGGTARLELTFERAGAVEVAMPVAPIGARGPTGAAGTMDHSGTMPSPD